MQQLLVEAIPMAHLAMILELFAMVRGDNQQGVSGEGRALEGVDKFLDKEVCEIDLFIIQILKVAEVVAPQTRSLCLDALPIHVRAHRPLVPGRTVELRMMNVVIVGVEVVKVQEES